MRMDQDISPPPLKRRKITVSGDPAHDEFLKGPGGDKEPGRMVSKTARCIRLFSWNINGIQPFLPACDASITSFFKPVNQNKPKGSFEAKPTYAGNPLREFLQRHCWPEILFLQEIKISPSDKKAPSTLLNFLNTGLDKEDITRPDTRYTLDVNRPRDKHNARGFGGKVYGVGTLLREDFASQYLADIRHADWDLEGRVTIVELRARRRQQQQQQQQQTMEGMNMAQHTRGLVINSHQNKLAAAAAAAAAATDQDTPLAVALLNIYAVNGTTAPYRSPKTGKVVGTRHDHKIAFHTRLRDECLELDRRGFSVVIAGDLNIARGRLDGHPKLRTFPRQHCVNRADFNAKFFGDEDIARAEAYLADGGGGGGGGGGGDNEKALNKELQQEPRFDGVDVFRALKGKERRYTYHPRSGDEWGSSCDRVDLIVVSKALADTERVIDTDILDSPKDRGMSDHVPIMVKILLDGSLSGKEEEALVPD